MDGHQPTHEDEGADGDQAESPPESPPKSRRPAILGVGPEHKATLGGRILGLSALAASVLLAVFVWPPRDSSPGPGDTFLGNRGLQIALPSDGLAASGSISWTHPAPAGLSFRLRALDPTASGAGAVLHESSRLTAMTWSDAEQIASWAPLPEVLIEIEALDASGQVIDRTSASLRMLR